MIYDCIKRNKNLNTLKKMTNIFVYWAKMRNFAAQK